MTLAQFVQPRRERWEQLNALLQRIETHRLRSLSRAELKRLGQLYRSLTSDLAQAQTNFPQSDLAQALNQLAGRAHPHVHRSRSLTGRTVWEFFRADLPRTFRRNLHVFNLAALIFVVCAALGGVATLLDENVAAMILSPALIAAVHRREMWTEHIFNVMPSSVMSTYIMTNNISVSFMTFAMGLTFGVGTCYLLALNGLMLGCITALCFQYGLLGQLVDFVTAHGVVEISVIIVAGTAGLLVGGALVNPGDYTRRDSLAMRGRDGVKLVLGTAPMLVVVGTIEGFVSPSPAIPAGVKMTLGLALGALFYLYLLFAGRGAVTAVRDV
jgi:uncharacterized membrane protein SpoIIM required for sporulation